METVQILLRQFFGMTSFRSRQGFAPTLLIERISRNGFVNLIVVVHRTS
jgi:hypothetical protein